MRTWWIAPDGFRTLRHSCFLSRQAAADYLGVCVRTIRHWDAGRCRVPWSAVKLLRLLRGGDLGALRPEWAGWTLNRYGLWSPDGKCYAEPAMRHWWLTCEQARFWREGYELASAGGVGAPAPADAREAVPLTAMPGRSADRPPASPVSPAPAPSRQTAVSGPARLHARRQRSEGATVPASGASGRGGGGALGFISNATSGSKDHETVSERRLRGVAQTPERHQNDVTFSTGVTHGNDTADAAPAARSGGPRGHGGGATGADHERVHGAGGAQLGGLSGEAAGPIQPPCGRPCPEFEPGDCPFPSCPERAESGGECAVPVRQRPEVQAVPRETVGGLKCDTRPSLTADRVPRLLNATGGKAPEGMMP